MTTRRLRRILGLRLGATYDWLEEIAFYRPHARSHQRGQPRSLTSRNLRQAVREGAAFLRRHQRGDGSWKGFLLTPGAATTWLTAHVAFVVDSVEELADPCWRAARYLLACGSDDGGWGYNRRVAVDCDSTAQALIVLDRFGLHADPFIVRSLAESQLPCGGFPTYASADPTSLPPTGWHAAHPEVSTLVAEALRRCGGFDERRDRCAAWLETQLCAGALPSYWWPGSAYGLWVQAKVDCLGRESAPLAQATLDATKGQPQMAMALFAAVNANVRADAVEAYAGRLLQRQLSDGSWLCAPCLRVTSPREMAASDHALGQIAADRRRMLSTAHAVAALASLTGVM